MAAAMLSSVISSMFLTSRASSITCWLSRTSMPAFCSANSIGGSTRAPPPVHPHRHVADAFGVEDSLDLLRRVAEQRQVGSGRAAQTEQAGAAMIGVQPRRVELVVPRRAAEVPDIRIAVSREQRVARELVARPFADDGAGGIADIVLVEREQRPQAGVRERGAHAREPVLVQPAEIDSLLAIDLRAARRLQRRVPAVPGIDVVRTDDLRLRMPALASHGELLQRVIL